MFKSIFFKYIAVMMVVILACFITLTALMSALISSYSSNFRKATVQNIASAMSVYVKGDYAQRAKETDDEIISSYGREFGRIIGLLSDETKETAIFTVNGSGKICSFATAAYLSVDSFFSVPIEEAKIPGALLERLNQGQTVTEVGNLTDLMSKKFIFSATPVFASGRYFCAVIVATPYVDEDSTELKKASVQGLSSAISVHVKTDYSRRSSDEKDGILFSYSNDFQNVVNLLSSESKNTSIFVVDKTNAVCAFGTATTNTASDIFNVPLSEAKIPPALAGELERGGTVSGTGNLSDLLKNDCIFAATPLFIDNEYLGAVVVATQNTGMDNMLRSTVVTLIAASLIIMLASLIAVYVISKKLTTPIRKMNDAAKEMSKGNFSTRIEVNGRDEVAELARSFNDMSASLGNLEKMRSTFISDVSHELRTPMTSIGGFIDSILDGAIPPEKEQYYLEIVSSEIRRLSRLVTSLLEISRMESGKNQMTLGVFDICEMARKILISNEQRLEEKELDVSFECDRDNIDVVADHDKIYQCLFNICDNAIKFSNPGGKYIVGIKDVGKSVEVSVFNEGIGISEEDLPFVFERFYKSDKSRGLDKKGVGLGLYLVKSMIEAHGERIWVESESGKWCRFTFTLSKKKAVPGGEI